MNSDKLFDRRLTVEKQSEREITETELVRYGVKTFHIVLSYDDCVKPILNLAGGLLYCWLRFSIIVLCDEFALTRLLE